MRPLQIFEDNCLFFRPNLLPSTDKLTLFYIWPWWLFFAVFSLSLHWVLCSSIVTSLIRFCFLLGRHVRFFVCNWLLLSCELNIQKSLLASKPFYICAFELQSKCSLFSLLHFYLQDSVFQHHFESRFCSLYYCFMTYVTSLFDECCFHTLIWGSYKNVEQHRTEKEPSSAHMKSFSTFMVCSISLVCPWDFSNAACHIHGWNKLHPVCQLFCSQKGSQICMRWLF